MIDGSSWHVFASEAPDLAADVEARLQAFKHHVIATLRKDGSPRVSGTEVQLFDGELYLGFMTGSMKAHDLQRDGRFALHSNPGDGSMAGGDAKISGFATPLDAERLRAYLARLGDAAAEGEPVPSEASAFGCVLTSVVHTAIHPDGDRLVIRTWHPGRGVTSVDRY